LSVQSLDQVSQGNGSMPPSLKISYLNYYIDLLCRGQQAETIIPLENGRKFVVCLDDGKGVEQSCPKGLFYHNQSQRCERSMLSFFSFISSF
jgi:hypothetical protein